MTHQSDIAISVRGLSKSYTIAHNQPKHTTMAEALMHILRFPRQKVEQETFWALQDVSFDIQQGDVVGIIGRNGAGKSTLLKILSRITEPTSGQIDLYGRVGSLLEVGTGFSAELTGRENIYMNGAILGMTRREITRQFDAIVDFSGTEMFLDTPVKRYSSGMYVRLAFAVAAHLNPEILIVDEVLAVGDAEFQKKCLGKMQDVAKSGRTVLFVSHNMGAVAAMCNRAILLNGGRIQMNGTASEVISLYQAEFMAASTDASDLRILPRKGTGDAKFTEVLVKAFDKFGNQLSTAYTGCDLVIETALEASLSINDATVGVIINDANMYRLVDMNSASQDIFLKMKAAETATVTFSVKDLLLKPGLYTMELWLGRGGIEMTDWIEQAITFHVADSPASSETARIYLAPYQCNFGVITRSGRGLMTV